MNYECNNQPQEPQDLKVRTKALRVIKMFGALPKQTEAQVLGKQLLAIFTTIAKKSKLS